MISLFMIPVHCHLHLCCYSLFLSQHLVNLQSHYRNGWVSGKPRHQDFSLNATIAPLLSNITLDRTKNTCYYLNHTRPRKVLVKHIFSFCNHIPLIPDIMCWVVYAPTVPSLAPPTTHRSSQNKSKREIFAIKLN